MKTGLDDGPKLPSQAALERAYAAIEAAQPITDADRINWLEKRRYFEVGLGFDGNTRKWAHEIRFRDRELKRYHGRSLREVIDRAIQGEGKDGR